MLGIGMGGLLFFVIGVIFLFLGGRGAAEAMAKPRWEKPGDKKEEVIIPKEYAFLIILGILLVIDGIAEVLLVMRDLRI